MARENQTLHISLAVFVALSLGLGVTSFRFYQLYDEVSHKAVQDRDEATKQQENARKLADDLSSLKVVIGASKDDDAKKISDQFDVDMKTLAATVPQKNHAYRNALEYQTNELKVRTGELADAKAEIESWKTKYREREGTKDAAIKKFQAEAEKAAKDLEAERTKFKQERDTLDKRYAQIASQFDAKRKQSEESVSKTEVELQEAKRVLEDTRKDLNERNVQYWNMAKENLDSVDGSVRWVNQRSGVVWIDLGRADALNRQTTFNVYDADVLETKNAVKKAVIEVTQIRGDHLAEARIVEHKVENPIVPGDKVDTPIWNPGEKRHFALAGFIDIDKDNGSDRDLIRTLITMNGGIIDAELDDKGKMNGEISVSTRFLVLGDAPTDKASPEMIENFSKMKEAAGKLGVEIVDAVELANRMGWKNESRLVSYGPGSNPDQFKAAQAEGVVRKANGPLDNRDRFPPRRPQNGGSTF